MPSLPAILGGTPIRPQGPPQWPLADAGVEQALQQLARTGDWGRYHGPHTEALCARLRELHQVSSALLTCSGTAAVELALRGIPVGPEDEVILSAYDFKANFTNVLLLGARPVLVDADPESGQLAVDRVASALSPRTRAVVASHLHGGVVDMPRLLEITRPAGIAVIEDACQMTLAQVHGRPAGSWGDVGVLSFGGSKLLSAGRGGALVTCRGDILQRMKLYRERGNDAYPLSEMQAAILLPQIDSLPARRGQRNAFVQSLRDQLEGRAGLRLFPSPGEGSHPDYYKLGIWYDPQEFEGVTRLQFCTAMRREGVPLDPGFRALHRIHARGRYQSSGELSVAERADEQIMTLHHPLLLEGSAGIEEFVAAVDSLAAHASMVRQVRVDVVD
jgi:dTDP-4-amino-4,6-dideoxygalactose transaminase